MYVHQTNRLPSPTLVALVFAILLIANTAYGDEPDHTAALKRISGGQVTDRFIEADRAFANRRDAQKALKALRLYRQLYAQHPQDAQAAWRLAMAHIFVGRRLSEDKNDQKKHFANGRDVGQKSIETDPQCAPCYFWTAVNMAFYGRRVGMLKMLFTLDTIREYLNKTIELDPDFGSGAAHRILGIMYYRMPGVIGGSPKLAKLYFDQALAIGPSEPMNYLEYVKFLSRKKGDANQALHLARIGAALLQPPADMVESADAWKELKAELAALEAELASEQHQLQRPVDLQATHDIDTP